MQEWKDKQKERRELFASNHRLIVDDGRHVASNKGGGTAASMSETPQARHSNV
jgi:hypothetical protein